MSNDTKRLGALHRKIVELQALLRAVQLAQEASDDELGHCMAVARRLLADIESDVDSL
jgi:hypothetical protein